MPRHTTAHTLARAAASTNRNHTLARAAHLSATHVAFAELCEVTYQGGEWSHGRTACLRSLAMDTIESECMSMYSCVEGLAPLDPSDQSESFNIMFTSKFNL